MDTRLESSSVGTKEWLEATQGWVIRAYVDSGVSTEPDWAEKHGATTPLVGQEPHSPEKRRPELPFGENIRDAIRSLKGR